MRQIAEGDDFLISLTDHNTINKKAYLEGIRKYPSNILLGVEIHICAYKDVAPKSYHCHIYFNFDQSGITPETIDELNAKLDKLYPDKKPQNNDPRLPDIQDILEAFDDYDFLLLPHGGQNHSTFDEVLPEGKNFDNAMQRSIYYNFFDGFTSRSDKKTEKTIAYLERLGVHEFVNLITCTDNYDPLVYPNSKSQNAAAFIPSWMYATPSFAGLRISLTDNSRLVYSNKKPKKWRESIRGVKLSQPMIDINVTLTPGLNVVIGESSSGKTLFIDSIVRKITQSGFSDSHYNDYRVSVIEVDYPDNLHPHYINQNYVTTVTLGERKINEIPIISRILPVNTRARHEIDLGKKDLDTHLKTLFTIVESIENLEEQIERIPILCALFTSIRVSENAIKFLQNIAAKVDDRHYTESEEKEDVTFLDDLEKRLSRNPFIKHDKTLIVALKSEIKLAREHVVISNKVKKAIENAKGD